MPEIGIRTLPPTPGHGAGTEASVRGTSGRRRKGWDAPVSLLDLVIIAVIIVLIALIAGVYWHQSRRAERQHDAGRGWE
jgi:hypothetical protein